MLNKVSGLIEAISKVNFAVLFFFGGVVFAFLAMVDISDLTSLSIKIHSETHLILLGMGIGLMAVSICLHLVTEVIRVRKKAIPTHDNTTSAIDGVYFANGNLQYKVSISSLSDKLILIDNPEWEGVGLFDGELYFGIYKIKDIAKEQLRGRWGAHRAKLRLVDGSLELWGLELKGITQVNKFEGVWIKEKQANR